MKKVIILVISLFLATVALATAENQAYIENAVRGEGVPTPVKVISPEVPGVFANSKVVFEFVVNESGNVENIKADTQSDPELVRVLSEAIVQWKFVPAIRDGKPLAVKVSLPVLVVDKS